MLYWRAMSISTLSRYGLRALLEMAEADDICPISSREISRRQNIPPTYLEQILSRLKRAGLVRSTRGAQGGYVLGRRPEEITVLEITETLDGPQYIADCHDGRCLKKCDDGTPCIAALFWTELEDTMHDILDTTSLQDIIDSWREKTRQGG